MPLINDRFQNKIDGTYVNAPDLHSVEPSKNIGLKEYNSAVLVHNWYEERHPFQKKDYPRDSSYRTDYRDVSYSKPDVIIRRNMIGAAGGKGTKHLIGMHDIDSSKNMITIYDETINQRARPAGQEFPEKRKWKIINDAWVPEKIDYPVQDTPTQWGLVHKKRNDEVRERDKYVSQLPNLSEYNHHFQKHPTESYLQKNTNSIPKEVSASFYDINNKLNNAPKFRSTSSGIREPQARDVLDTVYANMLLKSQKAPRTFYYLGKVPTNGLLDVYSMKDFETLTPVNFPTKEFNPANKVTDLTTLNN